MSAPAGSGARKSRLTPDICVIGAGSGGLTVAAAAAAFGVEVVLIEKGRMGGDCLNFGCVPSKALIAAAKRAHLATEAPGFGIDFAAPAVDFARVQHHVRDVIEAIAPNDSQERFTALGVTVLREAARFVDGRTVVAGDHEIAARRFVIATGSSPAIPPIAGLAGVAYRTNETLFDMSRLPAHLLVIGGGPIGLEMAQAHRRLGSAVTVIEAAGALGREDPELAAPVLDALRHEGVVIHEGTRVAAAAEAADGTIRLSCEKDGHAFDIEGTDLLVAVGRKANVDGLGLDAAGIGYGAKGIDVDQRLRTSNRRVYAVGDVAGGPQFTHVANHQAGLVVQQILFRLPARQKGADLPRVTFCDPELAQVGLSEAEARRIHANRISVLRWPCAENDRARAERRTAGLIKVVVDRRGRILGAGIAAAGAGEMIGFWSLAVARRLRLSDVRDVVAPYPTMSEIGKRAVLSYYAPLTRRPVVRWLVRVLRKFG